MKAIDFIAPALASTLTVVALAWLGRKNGAQPALQDGMLHFVMPKAYGIVGWVSIAIAALFIAGAVVYVVDNLAYSVFFFLLAVMFGWLGILLVRDGRHHRAACNETVIAVVDGNNRLKSCRWEDLASARVHPISKMIILRAKDGTRFALSAYLVGSDALFSIMARQTPFPVKDLVERARAMA